MKVLTAAIIALLLTHNSAGAQKLPASTTIGTNPAGTAFYAVSAGLAKVISGAGPMQSIVQPYTGSSTFLPLLDSGEIDFGIVNAVEMNLGYQGPAKLKISGKNPLPHVPNTRLIMRGSPLSVSLVVRKDSPMKMVHDIKGKRVTGEYPANIAIWFHVYTELANAGLTWDDVKVVPVPAVNDGVDALVQGRADAANHAIGVAKVKEADAAVGVRYLSLDCSSQGDARVRKAVPGYYLITLKSGSSTGIRRRHLRACVRYLYGRPQRVGQRSRRAFAESDLGQHRQASAAQSPVQRVDPRARRLTRYHNPVSSRGRTIL